MKVAQRFENQRARRRFLSQVGPLCRLAESTGREAYLMETGTVVRIREHTTVIHVCMLEGMQDTDNLFFVLDQNDTENMYQTSCLTGILTAAREMGVMRDVPADEVNKAVQAATLACVGCGTTQGRRKQCRTCREMDRSSLMPKFRGYYCCTGCQHRDWRRHRAEEH